MDAYYYFDGKESDLKKIQELVKSNNVEKMQVLEGEAAKAVSGNKAYKPVFMITSKNIYIIISSFSAFFSKL